MADVGMHLMYIRLACMHRDPLRVSEMRHVELNDRRISCRVSYRQDKCVERVKEFRKKTLFGQMCPVIGS
jgi:hypothetical protein